MNRCVLVVEDDPKIATTLKLYLEREGYRVKVTDNGRAALKEARELQPALILLDLMLPQLSGTDVCRILRRESDVYIIMLTARTTEADKLRGLDLGADDYVSKPFSPRELMARVRAVLRRQREDLPPKHPEIRINRNLLNNAIVHTPAGGVIAVRAFPAESFLQCVIEDTGSGIAAKDLPFIFERFYRADSSRDRASGGSGLGLAIVKQIVAAHGGKTWVETSIGKGTRIYFTLPSLKDSAR